MLKTVLVHSLRVLPAALISRTWGTLVRMRWPRWFARTLCRAFVAVNHIDLQEAETPGTSYPCLEDLFVRRLRPGVRPIDTRPDILVSPVDGQLGQCGTITDGRLVQAKGKTYSLAELLGGVGESAAFAGGSFATLYLAPHNYHRIHAPTDGTVVRATVLPGRLLPVFSRSTETITDLFSRNERIVTYMEHARLGTLAIVKIGATLVGRVRVCYDARLQTNLAGQRVIHRSYAPPIALKKGDELGVFELGSTVVLVAQARRLRWQNYATGMFVRVGQALGALNAETM